LDADGGVGAAGYPYAHLVRGALLEELGEHRAAVQELELAASHARNDHEQRQIRARIARLRGEVGR
jgi:predicted RNA polymerase sigma factor